VTVEYVFIERIVLDEESWREFCAEMETPRPPNAALSALFKHGNEAMMSEWRPFEVSKDKLKRIESERDANPCNLREDCAAANA